MKRGLIIGGGLVVGLGVVIVIAVVFLVSNLDSLIKDAVEKYGSEIIRADVRLDAVEIDAASGAGAMRGLTVGNPKGFATPSAFELGAISVKLDIATVTDDVIVVKEIIIAKPAVTYELGPAGNNVDAIRKNVDDYVKAHGGGAAKKDTGASGGEGPKLVIENLYIRDGSVSVAANIPLMEGRKMTAPLPDIHLADIGKDKDGASPGEVAERVFAEINKSVSKSMSGIGVGKTLDSLTATLEGATKGVTDAVKSVTEGAGGVAAGAGTAVKGATDSVGDAAKGVAEGAGEAVKGVTEGVGGAVKKLFGD